MSAEKVTSINAAKRKKAKAAQTERNIELLERLNDTYCYIEEQGAVCRIDGGGGLISLTAFKTMWDNLKVVLHDDGPERIAGSAWLRWKERNTANRVTCDPRKEKIFIEDGATYLNTWRQPGVDPTDDAQLLSDLKKIAEHLTRSGGPDALRYLWRHSLAALRFRAVKMRWAINMISTAQGIGKTQFGKAIMQAHGKGGKVLKKNLGLSQFNAPLLACTYALLDEWIDGGRGDVRKRYEWAKPLISDIQFQIEPKGRDPFDAACMTTFYFTGNHIDTAAIEDFDRRHYLIEAPDDPILDKAGNKDEALYRRVGEALEAGRMGGIVMEYALSEDVYPITPTRRKVEDILKVKEDEAKEQEERAELRAARLRGRVIELPEPRDWNPADFDLPDGTPEPLLWNVNPGEEPPATLAKRTAQETNRNSIDDFILAMLSDLRVQLEPLYPPSQPRTLSDYWGHASELAAIYNRTNPTMRAIDARYMGGRLSKFCVSCKVRADKPRVFLLVPSKFEMLSPDIPEALRRELLTARRQCEALKGREPPDAISLDKPFIETCKDLAGGDDPLPGKSDILRWAGEPMKLRWADEEQAEKPAEKQGEYKPFQ